MESIGDNTQDGSGEPRIWSQEIQAFALPPLALGELSPSLSFSFPNSKQGVITLSSQGCCNIAWADIYVQSEAEAHFYETLKVRLISPGREGRGAWYKRPLDSVPFLRTSPGGFVHTLGVPCKTVFEKRESTSTNQFENLDVLESIIGELFKNRTRISSSLCWFILFNRTQQWSAQHTVSC